MMRTECLQGAHRLFAYRVNSRMRRTQVVFASDEIMESVLHSHARTTVLNIETLLWKFKMFGDDEIAGQLATKLIQGVAFSHIKRREGYSVCFRMQPDGQGQSLNRWL